LSPITLNADDESDDELKTPLASSSEIDEANERIIAIGKCVLSGNFEFMVTNLMFLANFLSSHRLNDNTDVIYHRSLIGLVNELYNDSNPLVKSNCIKILIGILGQKPMILDNYWSIMINIVATTLKSEYYDESEYVFLLLGKMISHNPSMSDCFLKEFDLVNFGDCCVLHLLKSKTRYLIYALHMISSNSVLDGFSIHAFLNLYYYSFKRNVHFELCYSFLGVYSLMNQNSFNINEFSNHSIFPLMIDHFYMSEDRIIKYYAIKSIRKLAMLGYHFDLPTASQVMIVDNNIPILHEIINASMELLKFHANRSPNLVIEYEPFIELAYKLNESSFKLKLEIVSLFHLLIQIYYDSHFLESIYDHFLSLIPDFLMSIYDEHSLISFLEILVALINHPNYSISKTSLERIYEYEYLFNDIITNNTNTDICARIKEILFSNSSFQFK